ncbi:hypothetical protein AMECASPLE_036516 [Ameca splendens]|uniref:Uncharacterized protein n=1 Tax=Ameca splendens TaxID=208324 RepID=A0ABV0Z5L4_9TELE
MLEVRFIVVVEDNMALHLRRHSIGGQQALSKKETKLCNWNTEWDLSSPVNKKHGSTLLEAKELRSISDFTILICETFKVVKPSKKCVPEAKKEADPCHLC